MVKDAIRKAVDTNEGVLCEMTSKGYDEQGECVSFKLWSLRPSDVL